MRYMITDGRFHSVHEPNASTMMQAFNYGTSAFEGMRAYYRRSEGRWYLFRPDLHFSRLCRSAAAIGIDFAMTERAFIRTLSRLIRKNNYRGDLYIRPLVYRSALGVGLTRPSGHSFSVFMEVPSPSAQRPLRCCFVSKRRPTDGSYAVKLSGNYVLSFLSHQEAVGRGFDAGILLSSDGFVSESSVMNLFFVKDDVLYTPSLACGPLDGITRRTIIELARDELGVRVREGKYRPRKVLEADEIFLCGTGSGVKSVSRLEARRLNLSTRNLLARQIRELYSRIVRGQVQMYSDWLVPV